MSESCSCNCSCGGNRIVYSCSGGSNVGQIANDLARRLARESCAGMSCGIALGGDLKGFITSARQSDKNILIDGCQVACLRKVFERHNITNISHFIITDFGVQKNKDLFPESNFVNEIFDKLKQKL
ncbi:MAG: putative zinc-binding protein [bacterium]|nr:putative zinc-binding protein [bacterium]